LVRTLLCTSLALAPEKLQNRLAQMTRAEIRHWMETAICPGPLSPPGLVVIIKYDIEATGVDALGRPITANAFWPLTCLTKLAIADATVRLFPELDRRINDWLPEVRCQCSFRQLLTHTSGLPLLTKTYTIACWVLNQCRTRLACRIRTSGMVG